MPGESMSPRGEGPGTHGEGPARTARGRHARRGAGTHGEGPGASAVPRPSDVPGPRPESAVAYRTTVIRSAAGGAIRAVAEELAVRYCSKAARSSAPTRSFVPSPRVVKPSPPPARKLLDATR